MGKLTGVYLEDLEREGFIVIPDYHTGDWLEALQAAQRRILPTNGQTQRLPADRLAQRSADDKTR